MIPHEIELADTQAASMLAIEDITKVDGDIFNNVINKDQQEKADSQAEALAGADTLLDKVEEEVTEEVAQKSKDGAQEPCEDTAPVPTYAPGSLKVRLQNRDGKKKSLTILEALQAGGTAEKEIDIQPEENEEAEAEAKEDHQKTKMSHDPEERGQLWPV